MNNNATYEPIIGFEIHAQLNTMSKLFCSCSTAAMSERDVEPNLYICPICTGQPGSLPSAVNRRAIVLATRLALAFNSELQQVSAFDRKNYFYPDLPKGYQISQYYCPIGLGGGIEITTRNDFTKYVRLNRIHVEEDAGKIKQTENFWLVDMNRCGVPLAEIVTEPDIHSVKDAIIFLKEVALILQQTGICLADMSMGNLRFDVNISVREAGAGLPSFKTEIKNLNSFQAVEEAIVWELERQKRLLMKGEMVESVTIHWNEENGVGQLSRAKETAAGYRYFREPDQLNVRLNAQIIEDARNGLVDLPNVRRQQLATMGLDPYDVEMLVQHLGLGNYFYAVLRSNDIEPTSVVKWIINDIWPIIKSKPNEDLTIHDFPISPQALADLLCLLKQPEWNTRKVREILAIAVSEGFSPQEIIVRKLVQPVDNSQLEELVAHIVTDNPAIVEKYCAGKVNALNALVGPIMRETQGKVDPGEARRLIQAELDRRCVGS